MENYFFKIRSSIDKNSVSNSIESVRNNCTTTFKNKHMVILFIFLCEVEERKINTFQDKRDG